MEIGNNIEKKVGDLKFNALLNNEEKEIKFSDFKGKKIVLYFYPRDLTPGCTTQACNLRDNFEEFKNKKIQIIGVSKDSLKSHLNFSIKKKLPFILISDGDLKLNKLFDVWKLKKFMGKEYFGTVRTTFLIDENLKIIDIIKKPIVKNHSFEIFEKFNK